EALRSAPSESPLAPPIPGAPLARGEPFPEAEEIGGPQGAIVQPVPRPAGLTPDHPPMVRTHRPGEAGIAQRAQDLAHVDASQGRRVRALVKLPLAGPQDVSAMHEI